MFTLKCLHTCKRYFKKTVHNMTFVVTLAEKALILELSVVYESLNH